MLDRFFGFLQRLLIRDVLLAIARLTDDLRVGKFTNLTVCSLLLDPALAGHRSVRYRLMRRVVTARAAAEPIRVHRNKYLAHLDHQTAVSRQLKTLPELPRVTIAAAITALEAAYNEHGRSLRNTDTTFELHSLGSARALVPILETSERWRLVRQLQADDEVSGHDAT